ncbi:MAG: nucleotide exchange factor GrpE [Sporichthyaceae bacterium]|nr:nucleotide exchange factor GrpE [Sporichthyaceae bacterium]
MANSKPGQSDPEAPPPRPTVRDRRRIDPQTGAVRDSGESAGPGQAAQAAVAGVAKARAAREAAKAAAHGGKTPSAGAGTGTAGPAQPGGAGSQVESMQEAAALAKLVAELEATVAERTGDLQRVQAEYANYRKRVERDRGAIRELAVADALSELLSVLDDVGRARDHGELEGGFKSVGEALEQAVNKLGLERFGAVGDPFDPAKHEAFLHSYDDEVDEPTCAAILQPGYRIKDRIVRPARVAVAEPEPYDPSGGRTTAPLADQPADAGGTADAKTAAAADASDAADADQPGGPAPADEAEQ